MGDANGLGRGNIRTQNREGNAMVTNIIARKIRADRELVGQMKLGVACNMEYINNKQKWKEFDL